MKKMIPKPQSMASFAELTKEFLLTSAVFEINFKILAMIEENKFRDIITNAPRSLDVLLPKVVKLCEVLMGKKWNEDISDMVIAEKLSVNGIPSHEGESCSHIKIKNHKNGIIYFVHEFHIKWIVDPMISRVAKTIFNELDFTPTKATRILANTAGYKIKVTMERKYHNFVINMKNLDDQVHLLSLGAGDKRYDVLLQTINSIVRLEDAIETSNTEMDAPIDYSTV